MPTVEADANAAAIFAVGSVQGADRRFQMDLRRRLIDGSPAAALRLGAPLLGALARAVV